MNGSENVGAMVVYSNGRPDKKAYRKFMIKGFEGQDDYRSLSEVLNRRIDEYENSKNNIFIEEAKRKSEEEYQEKRKKIEEKYAKRMENRELRRMLY